ncbi:hypothetical protein ES707_21483 [subsurface metagenome]
MKCPLIVNMRGLEPGLKVAFPGDCIKEECAWWDEAGSQCSHLAKMKVLVNIESCLELIVYAAESS